MSIHGIPFVDLAWQHRQIAGDVDAGFARVLERGDFILGADVERFEAEFAEYSDVENVVGVGSGTDAIELAVRAAGVEPGSEVVLPANTFVATAEAVERAGARVVLADCDEDFLIDVAAAGAAVGPETSAVVGVHLYGQTAPMSRLREVVPPSVLLIEDAAQSQGARHQGRRAGSLGDIAATSFYPGKNLGAYGDGGAVMTHDGGIAERARALRNHGGIRKYEHLEVGMTSRLDTLQAVVLRAKLAHLDEWNDRRRAAAAYYDELLSGVEDVVSPRTVAGNEHVFHLYVIRTPRRQELAARLDAAGIANGIHYPAPVHLVPAFAHLGYARGAFPTAERLAGEILSLPMFPGITPEQQERVVDVLAARTPVEVVA